MIWADLELSYHRSHLCAQYLDIREEEFVDSAPGNSSPACINAGQWIGRHDVPFYPTFRAQVFQAAKKSPMGVDEIDDCPWNGIPCSVPGPQ